LASNNLLTNSLLQRAYDSHYKGEYEEAVNLYRQVIKLDKKNHIAYHNLGLIENVLGHSDKAKNLIKKSIELNSKYTNAHYNLALIYFNELDFQSAKQSLLNARKIEPNNLDAAILLALCEKNLGAYHDAIKILNKILEHSPNEDTVYFYIGECLYHLTCYMDSLYCFDKAIEINKSSSKYYFFKANVLKEILQYEEAIKQFNLCLQIDPHISEVYNNLGIVYRELGYYEKSLENYNSAIALDPKNILYLFNKANILSFLDKNLDAISIYKSILEIDEKNYDSYINLGNCYKEIDCYSEALNCYVLALSLKNTSEVHINIGSIYYELNDWNASIKHYDLAIQMDPFSMSAFVGKGNVYRIMGDYLSSIENYNRALSLSPKTYEDYKNTALINRVIGNFDAELNCLEQALKIRPNDKQAAFSKGTLFLLTGKIKEGFSLYENRKTNRIDHLPVNISNKKVWTGKEAIENKTILIHYEQGLGDTIQFSRYLKRLNELNTNVLFYPQKPLCTLMGGHSGKFTIVDINDPGLVVDFHASLMSLPAAFETDLDTIPVLSPYLTVDPDRILYWRNRIGKYGIKIGICWKGTQKSDRNIGRSFPLTSLIEIGKLQGIRLISLMKQNRAELQNESPHNLAIEYLGDDFDSGPDAFLDTAAVMENLDLVITSDTSVAHLAGALGRPTWIALSHVPEWRWMLNRDDTPWYPTARLFRQKEAGVWAPVFEQMLLELNKIFSL